MEKDRVAEYWDYEIKRAAEDTAKAFAEYQQAKKEEGQAFYRKINAEVNQVAEEAREEAYEIHRQKSIYMSHKRDTYWIASKWECIARGEAESYKKRKAAKEANK